ncbi:hypothetical protein NDA01_19335 [Trichocoleus desertorum AS-A10]|uniref:peptidase C39 n=1 Tax=Trichocoleus desertorum TaxID=1481672 RepID=UPI003298132F
MFLLIISLISFLPGIFTGQALARRGFTAANALQHRQKQVYVISLLSLGVGTLLSIVLVAGRSSPWVPNFLLLYVGAYLWDAVLAVCCFCTGLILSLELPGWKDIQRLQQLVLFLVVSLSATCFLAYYQLPIDNLVQAARVSEEVVLQTTPYTCAAASIATIAQIIKPESSITELDVTKLAGTDRTGTSTIAEIYAMQVLGLDPQYERNLSIQDLVNRQQLAVLHVMEPVGESKISHAIALLAIDPVKRTLLLGNPLYGRQVKTFAEMQDYWLKEAVFVSGELIQPS